MDENKRLISRKGCETEVDLEGARVSWAMFLAFYQAKGRALTKEEISELSRESSARRQAKSELNSKLVPLAIKIDLAWRLVSDGSDASSADLSAVI